MAEKEKTEGDEAAKVVASKPSSPLPLILGLIIGVPLVCYLMIQFLVLPKMVAAIGAAAPAGAAEHGKAGGEKKEKEQNFDFGKIMVNLSGSGASRYLRLNLVFASKSPEIKELIEANKVALSDAIITVLSSQTLTDLESNDGKEAARRTLMSRINGILGGDIVHQIYFTEFVIQ